MEDPIEYIRQILMVYRNYFLFVAFLIFILQGETYAQANEFEITPSFKNISVEDGLSQSIITEIIQDSKGFMWFGTWDGLNRYDGHKFEVFRHDTHDLLSVGFDKINSLNLNKVDDIWVEGNKGIIRFHTIK